VRGMKERKGDANRVFMGFPGKQEAERKRAMTVLRSDPPVTLEDVS
jgi:hypothetical protein